MQEYDLEDLGEFTDDDTPLWQQHDWSAQEVIFVQEFLRTGKRRDAYITAFKDDDSGYDVRDPANRMKAGIKANAVLAKPHMRLYVAEMHKKLIQRLKVNQTNVLQELAKLGYSNMTDFVVLQYDGTPQFDVSGLTRDQFAAVQEMTIDTYIEGAGDEGREVRSVKVKLAPKTPALEALGRHLKLFTDVIQTNETASGDIIKQRRRARQLREKAKKDGPSED